MGWESKRSYPLDVSTKVTVQATTGQKGRWIAAAKRRDMQTPGAFLAWAADMYLALVDAYERQTIQYADDCNPSGSGL
jgi:hypothetical protein